MNRKTFAWFLVAGLLSAAAWAQTADEIIEKHLQAMGGKDKLKAVQSERLTGKMVMGQGMEAPFTLEMSRPNKMRMEFTFQGMTGVQAFDGKTGWSVMPFMGKTDPEAMPEEEVKRMQEQADMDGLFLDYKEHGRTVELMGKEELEGTPVYKLKVTQKSGDVVYAYIDAEQFLQLKQAGKTKVRGQEIESETIFGDFKKVGRPGLPPLHRAEGRGHARRHGDDRVEDRTQPERHRLPLHDAGRGREEAGGSGEETRQPGEAPAAVGMLLGRSTGPPPPNLDSILSNHEGDVYALEIQDAFLPRGRGPGDRRDGAGRRDGDRFRTPSAGSKPARSVRPS